MHFPDGVSWTVPGKTADVSIEDKLFSKDSFSRYPTLLLSSDIEKGINNLRCCSLLSLENSGPVSYTHLTLPTNREV